MRKCKGLFREQRQMVRWHGALWEDTDDTAAAPHSLQGGHVQNTHLPRPPGEQVILMGIL